MPRIELTSDINFYIDNINGNDSNDGLTPWDGTSGTPKKTLNAAWEEGALKYDLQGFYAKLKLSPNQTHNSLATNLGWLGQRGYGSVIIEGSSPNDNTTIVQGTGDAFQFGAGSSCGIQCLIQNLRINAPYGSGINIFGGGNGVIASNVIFGNCVGSAIIAAHGAEAALQNYILFLGLSYGCLAQAITGGRFTGGESATWAIGNNMSVSLATLYCADGQMNLGGLVSVNPRLVSGNQVGCTANGTILTGGYSSNIPGNLNTSLTYPYVNEGGVVT